MTAPAPATGVARRPIKAKATFVLRDGVPTALRVVVYVASSASPPKAPGQTEAVGSGP